MKIERLTIAFGIAVLATTAAQAHTGLGTTSGFLAGVMHPLTGIDHLLAMMAVGFWAAQRGGKALWLWPATFVGSMVAGGALGMAGVPVPFVEQGIQGSLVVLGLLVALGARPSLAIGCALIGLAGIFHGHAHGAEAPETASGLEYAAGFVVATASLHAAGVGLAVLASRLAATVLVRAAGVVTALVGVGLAFAS
jgi:urease accessory protein